MPSTRRSTECSKLHLRPNATLMELGWSPISATSSLLPEASAERWSYYEPIFPECYFRSFSRRELSGEHFSLSTFADNLFDAFFWHRLVPNNGVRTNLPKFQTSILCWAQVDPIHCIMFRSPMNLIMQFSFLVEICNKLCFADIAVDRIKRSEENCLPSFSFLSSCDQSSYCNRVLVSCSTYVIDEFFSCVRNHLVIISLGETKISPECPWIARKNFNHPSSSLQISNIVLKLPR